MKGRFRTQLITNTSTLDKSIEASGNVKTYTDIHKLNWCVIVIQVWHEECAISDKRKKIRNTFSFPQRKITLESKRTCYLTACQSVEGENKELVFHPLCRLASFYLVIISYVVCVYLLNVKELIWSGLVVVGQMIKNHRDECPLHDLAPFVVPY